MEGVAKGHEVDPAISNQQSAIVVPESVAVASPVSSSSSQAKPIVAMAIQPRIKSVRGAFGLLIAILRRLFVGIAIPRTPWLSAQVVYPTEWSNCG